MIEVVQEICYLGDVVGSCDDVQSSVTAGIRAGYRKLIAGCLKNHVGESCH